MLKTVKEGTLRDFLLPILLQNFEKLKGDSLESLKKFRNKTKNGNFNGSLIVPKNLEKVTLWDFLTFVPLQNIKQTEGWTLCKH